MAKNRARLSEQLYTNKNDKTIGGVKADNSGQKGHYTLSLGYPRAESTKPESTDLG